MLKLVIADDDTTMRFVLRKALEKYEEIQVVAEVATGQETVKIFEQEKMDIVFLDVDMPGMNGVEAAKLILDINPKCVIVFITAHDDYMQEAFELYAFDYIVKPFKMERLHKTVKRIIEMKVQIASSMREKLRENKEELLLKVKDGMAIIKKDDILMVERENRQTIVITKNGEYTVNRSLQDIEQILPIDTFIRSHKSYIINIEAIESIEVYGRWTYIVKFYGIKRDALLTKEKSKWLKKKYDTLDAH